MTPSAELRLPAFTVDPWGNWRPAASSAAKEYFCD